MVNSLKVLYNHYIKNNRCCGWGCRGGKFFRRHYAFKYPYRQGYLVTETATEVGVLCPICLTWKYTLVTEVARI